MDGISSKHFVTVLVTVIGDEGMSEFGWVIVEVAACLFYDFKFMFPKFCKFTGSFSKHEVEGSFEVQGSFEVGRVILEVAFSFLFLFFFFQIDILQLLWKDRFVFK